MAAGIARIVAALIVALAVTVGAAARADAAPLAANRIVTIVNFAFSPASITVNVGDTITWTNTDAAIHSARSTTGAFDTLTLSEGQSKTITFSVPGTYPYICGIHGASMSGTVVVVGQTATATPVPTPTPKPLPTAPSIAPTDVATATPQPTIAPTIAPTPSPSPSPSVATSAPATPAPQPTASPSPSASLVNTGGGAAPSAVIAAANTDSAPGPLLVAGGAVLIVGLVGAAFVLLRR